MSQQERKIIVIPAKPQTAVQEAQRSLRVAAYCRVSTEEEEQQSSYEAQCSYGNSNQKHDWNTDPIAIL